MKKGMDLRTKRGCVFKEFSRLCREYGTFRLCTQDGHDGRDILLLFSPPIGVAGDVPTIPAYILNTELWRLAVEGFGSVKVAAAAFGSDEQLTNYGK